MSAGRELRDEAAEALYVATEWSGCSGSAWDRVPRRMREDFYAAADAVLAVVEPRIRAEALRGAADFLEANADAAQGHANPRDYEIVAWLREKAAASTGEGDRPRCWRSECRNTCYYPDVCATSTGEGDNTTNKENNNG